ncbi:hypothetical protein QTP88_029540 [Uroleucon formosanum]
MLPLKEKKTKIKEEFYEEITEIYDRAPKNTVRIVIGDFNAKIGREIIYRSTIGLHSAHEQSNDNVQRRIAFATSRNMTISSTFFPHKDIHKYTWKSPDGNTFSQIDHMAINKRFKSSILDIRTESKELFETERKRCKQVIQREKRKYMNEIIHNTEQDYTQGRVRNFFAAIKRHQKYNPTLKVIKDKHNRILLDQQMKASRWQEYFEELLNGEVPVTSIPAWEDERAEQEVKDTSLDETLRAINRLKNWKAPGSDGIPAELIKYGGLELHKTIHELCSCIWNEEIIPEEWNKAIFSQKSLNYQCGFRKGKSTIDQLATIEQLLEKKYEYRQNIWQVFVDLKKAYDSIHRDSLYNIMYEFGFPRKLISLTKMCMNGTRYQVRVDCTLSEEFEGITGLKQGDALSPILFNIALEKVIRSVQSNKLGINIGKTTLDVLRFADDLNLVGENKEMIVRNTKTLIQEAKKIGLEINEEKTKVMETLPENDEEDLKIDYYVFEKAYSFKYLGVTITEEQNYDCI